MSEGLRAVVGGLIVRVKRYGFPAKDDLSYPGTLDQEVNAILKAGQFDQIQRRAQKAEALATDALRALEKMRWKPDEILTEDLYCTGCNEWQIYRHVSDCPTLVLDRPEARALLEPGT